MFGAKNLTIIASLVHLKNNPMNNNYLTSNHGPVTCLLCSVAIDTIMSVCHSVTMLLNVS